MMHRAPHPHPLHFYYEGLIYCAGCGHALENEVAKLDKQIFHVKCFVCHSCKSSLVGKEVYVKDGRNFDHKCYISFFSDRCDICHHYIIGNNETYIKTKEKTYHQHCYVCSQCGNSLKRKRYYIDGNKRICQNCVAGNRFLPSLTSEAMLDEVAIGNEVSEEL